MAKEFKDYDKLYAKYKHTLMPWERLDLALMIAKVVGPTRWDLLVDTWSPEQIKFAVYDCETAEEWQKFRVSLKGFSTKSKLMRLKNYYIVKVYEHLASHRKQEFEESGGNSASLEREHIWNIEKCRIDNYINAITRSGHLSSDGNYKVLK